jgi:hypothetical protein
VSDIRIETRPCRECAGWRLGACIGWSLLLALMLALALAGSALKSSNAPACEALRADSTVQANANIRSLVEVVCRHVAAESR